MSFWQDGFWQSGFWQDDFWQGLTSTQTETPNTGGAASRLPWVRGYPRDYEPFVEQRDVQDRLKEKFERRLREKEDQERQRVQRLEAIASIAKEADRTISEAMPYDIIMDDEEVFAVIRDIVTGAY